MSGCRAGHDDSKIWIFEGFLGNKKNGLCVCLVLVLSGHIIATRMKRLTAWVASLGCPIFTDFDRVWWACVGHNCGFSWRHVNLGLTHRCGRDASNTHYSHQHEACERLGDVLACKLFADFGRFWVALRDLEFQNFMAQF